ncbi:MAG: type II toxin-antitoxin system VapC family toxin [Candidatus Solibacter sp.]
MIILDTNVLSEALKPNPAPIVLTWLAALDRMAAFTTAVTQAEILYGIESLPDGKRRAALLAAAETVFRREFAGRVLSFDENAARAYAQIVSARNAAGRPISQFDAMIAAIARAHHATVATRNTGDFDACGLALVNPWKD